MLISLLAFIACSSSNEAAPDAKLRRDDPPCFFDVSVFGAEAKSVVAEIHSETAAEIWYPYALAPSNVYHSERYLGDDLWAYTFVFTRKTCEEVRLDLRVTYVDGTSLCDIGSTWGSGHLVANANGDKLSVTNLELDDNGDGKNDRCAVRIE